jgi:alkanesulfonate monooxygenase SsuD/methylene tetrahydromethanopterin reductase-like flavin-dependent oxidoreductase (luciferase family)
LRIGYSIEPVGATAAEILDTARAAEDLGFDGVALFDELTDVTGRGLWSHEPWTLPSAIAVVTTRVTIGPLVLNQANRDPGTLAVAAATLRDLSGGRLWPGIGAGTGADSPFAADQHVLGRTSAGAATRRARLIAYLDAVRSVWSSPDAAVRESTVRPRLIVGAFGARPRSWPAGTPAASPCRPHPSTTSRTCTTSTRSSRRGPR